MADEIKNNGAEVQQAVDAAMKEQKKKKKKKRLIILLVIVIFLIVVIAVSSSGTGDNKVESIDETAVSQSVGETTTQGTQKIKAGNAVTTDTLKISYLSCNSNWKEYDSYSAPESGNKIIRAEFTFENISSTDQSLSGITCYADNKKCEEYYFADDYSSPVLETISAGRTLNGILYYEVPKDAEEIELEFESDYWSSEKIIFVVE